MVKVCRNVLPILPIAIVITAIVIGVFRPLRFQSDVVADVFAADAAVRDVEAIGPAVVFSDGIAFFIVVVVFRFAVENAEADGVAGVVEVRMGIREDVVLVGIRIAAEFPADIGLIACTAQVRFSQAEDADQAVRIGVAGTDGNRPGLLFRDVDFDDDIFRITLARQETDVDVFKITRIVYALDTAAGSILIEDIAFLHTQFTHDDLILGLRIAAKVDIFNARFGNSNVQSPFVVEADIGDEAHHITGIGKGRVDIGYVMADDGCIERRPRRRSDEFHQIVRAERFIADNIDFLDDRIHLDGIVQGNAFWCSRKGWLDCREQACRPDDVEVVTDVVHIDGITDTHGQLRQEFLFDLGFRYGTDRNGCGYLVDIRFQVGIGNGFTVRQGNVLAGLDDSHGISWNGRIELHVTSTAHIAYFIASNLWRRIDRSRVEDFIFLVNGFGCFLLNRSWTLASCNSCQFFCRFITGQSRFSRFHGIGCRFIIRRGDYRIDSCFLVIRRSGCRARGNRLAA